MAELSVRFWGVRGSLATPGRNTAKYGGNTSCVEIRAGDERIIFDMGSGLRELGATLVGQRGVKATCFLSHYHWDHIQGLPFFGPAYDPTAQLTIYGATRGGKSVREILAGQMINPYFPVSLGGMQAELLFRAVENGGSIQVGPATIFARELCHPGGALGFRVTSGDCSVVYATDFEHGLGADDALVELSRGAEMLIFDATYTDAEYEKGKLGWGHSTWEMGVRIAKAAGVKKLVLFHHDPSHTDRQVDAILRAARHAFPGTDAAKEGKVYELPATRRRLVTRRTKPVAVRAAAKRARG
jgi:phosphoribosyl 1,2-cyclic phosphodiesterase